MMLKAQGTAADQVVNDLRIQLLRAVQKRFHFLQSEEVEDFVQEALLRVTRTLGKAGSEVENLSAFAKRTAFNLVLDEIRRRQCLTPVALPTESRDLTPTPERDPESRFTSKQQRGAIFECLRKLKESRRIALFLKLHGHSAKEIGAMLDWPRRRVENLVFRGRNDLTSCLRKKGIQGAPR